MTFEAFQRIQARRDFRWCEHFLHGRERPDVPERILYQSVAVAPEHIQRRHHGGGAGVHRLIEGAVGVRHPDLENTGGSVQRLGRGQHGILHAIGPHARLFFREAYERLPDAQVDVQPHRSCARRAVQFLRPERLLVEPDRLVHIRHHEAGHDYAIRRFRSLYRHDCSLRLESSAGMIAQWWPTAARARAASAPGRCAGWHQARPPPSAGSGSRDARGAPSPAGRTATPADAARSPAAKWKTPRSVP
jgi:hypothetical protein